MKILKINKWEFTFTLLIIIVYFIFPAESFKFQYPNKLIVSFIMFYSGNIYGTNWIYLCSLLNFLFLNYLYILLMSFLDRNSKQHLIIINTLMLLDLVTIYIVESYRFGFKVEWILWVLIVLLFLIYSFRIKKVIKLKFKKTSIFKIRIILISLFLLCFLIAYVNQKNNRMNGEEGKLTNISQEFSNSYIKK